MVDTFLIIMQLKKKLDQRGNFLSRCEIYKLISTFENRNLSCVFRAILRLKMENVTNRPVSK